MSRLQIAAAAGLSIVSSLHGAVIYGGPTFDSTTNTGDRFSEVPSSPGSTAGDGIAVGYATKYAGGRSLGNRAIRWDAGGTATELGILGTSSTGVSSDGCAYAVSSTGVAAGYVTKYNNNIAVGNRAVRWDAGGTAATELGNLGTNSSGDTESMAFALNNSGTAVGFAIKHTGGNSLGQRAVRWDAGGTVATELDNLGTDSTGSALSAAYAVNAGGAAVGYSVKYSGGTNLGLRAVRWDAGGSTATELGSLGTSNNGSTNSRANALNASGDAVGFAAKYSNGVFLGPRAVRWEAGGTAAIELGNLGTDSGGSTNSTAYKLNASGTAVGSALKYAGGTFLGQRAVRWDAGGTAATELANLGTDSSGSASGQAYSINSHGIAVGFAQKYAGGTFAGNRAVAWGLDGAAIDLNILLATSDATRWTLRAARGISDTNWISGLGDYDPDGTGPLVSYTRGFLIKMGYGGDADLNDKVDFNDFLILQNNFGSTNCTFSDGDFNYDGVVDFNDFLVLQNTFGTTLNGTRSAATAEQVAAITTFGLAGAVPEPTGWGVMAVCGIALLRHRRGESRRSATPAANWRVE